MTDKQANHGGAREGAGRPTAGTVQATFRLKRSTFKALGRFVKTLPDDDKWGARSAIADAAIRARLGLPPEEP